MGIVLFILALFVAVLLLVAVPKLPDALKRPVAMVALLLILAGVVATPVVYVGESELGVVVKTAFGKALPPDKIIATAGEMGPQAKVLSPGWHWGYIPFVFKVESFPVTRIEAGEIGILSASDGKPLPAGEIYAPEWAPGTMAQMIDAEQFLGSMGGFRGPQSTVLTPGSYRLNPKLFKVTMVKVTNIPVASVGVVKSNVGTSPTTAQDVVDRLVEKGERGIWRTHLKPQEYYLNTSAYEVTMISTKATVIEFTKNYATTSDPNDERAITVRSADGFTFPVDVRIEYQVEPANAPLLVSTLKDDKESLHSVLSSAVRANFRNSAEGVKALDYVQQRSHQESLAVETLRKEMAKYGVAVNAVRIGDVGDAETLGTLLKTQTDREIAKQEQVTFQEQQRSAEQKKALSRTTQESVEEMRLATAKYEVKIADESKAKKITEATGEAEAIRIKATAQAEAFTAIAAAIGPNNAAVMEMLRVVGERNINITPRVYVGGGAGASGSTGGSSAALIGTMLDSLTSREDAVPGGAAAPATGSPSGPAPVPTVPAKK
jgi:uncharacterized membrane protein YqiK